MHGDQAVEGRRRANYRCLGAEFVTVDEKLNLVGDQIAKTATGNFLSGEIIDRRNVGANDQGMLQLHRGEHDHLHGSAAGRRRGDGAGDDCVIDRAVEQCRRGQAGAHLDHLDVETAPRIETFLHCGVNRKIAERRRGGGDADFAAQRSVGGKDR